MMEAMIVVLVIGLVTGAYAGLHFERTRQVDYRKRWEEALLLIDDEEARAALKAKHGSNTTSTLSWPEIMRRMVTEFFEIDDSPAPPKIPPRASRDSGSSVAPAATAPQITQKQLDRMSSYQRFEIEAKRIKAGKPPRDNMSGLSSYHRAELIKLRDKHGWD